MLWIRVLHHICNDHTYCEHADDVDIEDKEYIEAGSPAFVALLSELDESCNDSITESICANNNINCTCILCSQ